MTLFERARRRIRLTDAGRRLLGPAQDLLARAEAFVREAPAAAGSGPARIAVGFVGTALTTGVLPNALRALRGRHPDLQIDLRHANSDAQIALLRAGELDVALVQAVPKGARDLQASLVIRQPYRLAVLRSGPLARRALTARLLAGASWIGVRTSERWLEACAVAGFVPRVIVEVSDYASALALVDAGMGVAMLPASQRALAPPGVLFRPLRLVRMISALWAVTGSHPSPHASELARRLAA